DGTDQFTGGAEDVPLDGAPPSGSPGSMGPCVGPMQQAPQGPHGFPPIGPGPFQPNQPQMNMQRPPFAPDLQMLQNLLPFASMGQNPYLSDFLFIDETTNWYSSDDGEEGSVTSILKSLKKQSEMQQAQTKPVPPPSGPVGDPRLKERGPPSDPRIKMDPRQRPLEVKKECDSSGDPRLSRDPRKMREQYQQQGQTVAQKPLTGEDDDEGERELRDRAALIPLDPSPGVVLRDPRCQLKQFSHIKVDILLQRPAFAETVVWAPEDLIPSLIPKQEHSINLPLPPLIANAQMNRSTLPDSHPVSSPPPVDPRLAAARLKTRVPSGSMDTRMSVDRPVDPRQAKSLDPRLKRTASLDSKMLGQKEPSSTAAVDPRLQKSNAMTLNQTVSPKSEPDKLPPYAPRLASSGGGLESPTTILGGISLYDPRNQTEQKEQADPPKKTGILKNPVKKDSTPPPSLSPNQRSSSFEEVKSTETVLDQSPPRSSDTPPPPSPIKPAAVHNLPIQALAGLMRPQYIDPRQEAEDRTLKDVFKTFDPTASPFCQ
uniref:Uncharacterized protein n=1 Tax=Periophthalmus magnuspinnatus TaxID=409849 RepID=A0A3B3ZBK9_9GOBI